MTSIDLVEVDATADAPDGRTVRLVALCILEAIAGYDDPRRMSTLVGNIGLLVTHDDGAVRSAPTRPWSSTTALSRGSATLRMRRMPTSASMPPAPA